jgi:MarR family transcriptional regulator, negative regulator of the multidrug operon emrRAB
MVVAISETSGERVAREAHLNVLIAAARFGDAMEQVCRTEGVSVAQFHVLWVLCLHEQSAKGVPTGAIADGLINRASDTTRLIDRLADAKLAERLPSPHDRRIVLVRPTSAGRRAVARLLPKLRDFHREEWSSLNATELRELSRLLAKALWGNA